jgi:hypothetical protein
MTFQAFSTYRSDDDTRWLGLRTNLLVDAGRSLGMDLSDVIFSEVAAQCVPSGVLAWAFRDRIFLSSAVRTLPEADRRQIVAHELAHVAQKRLPACGRHSGADYEAEADAAGAAICAGQSFDVRRADPTDLPRFWGPAGHYYTCYFVMLAAGVRPVEARVRAFFCQMPDQVAEFDAAVAAVDAFTGASFNSARPMHPYQGKFGGMHNKELKLQDDAIVESGLHSLTGHSSAGEQTYREQRLREMFASDDHLGVGLALHAFGDSFAHVQFKNPSLMYKCGIGHAAELLSDKNKQKMVSSILGIPDSKVTEFWGSLAMAVRDSGSEVIDSTHAPDDVTFDARREVYRSYIRSLYYISRSRAPAGAILLPPHAEALLMQAIALKTRQDVDSNEAVVIYKIRSLATHVLRNTLSSYAPECEPEMKFSEFFFSHEEPFRQAGYDPGVRANYAKVRDYVMSLGKQWARGYTDFSFTP